jgi:hypothetical protein
MLNFFAYCLYPPLYIAGPIITFNDFIWQVSASFPYERRFSNLTGSVTPANDHYPSRTALLCHPVPILPVDHGDGLAYYVCSGDQGLGRLGG